jgi:hypothetical protein
MGFTLTSVPDLRPATVTLRETLVCLQIEEFSAFHGLTADGGGRSLTRSTNHLEVSCLSLSLLSVPLAREH